jgi:predicted dehydrogenase
MNVALVGCGAVSELLYVKVLRQLEPEGVVTTALIDPNPRRTAAVGAGLPGARPFISLDAALAEARPDLAIIAAPHRLHAEQVVQCLDASVAVLCEKPMATTVEECDRMIAAAERNKGILAIGHFRRFFPCCQIIKSMLASGALGAVRSFRVLEGETYSWPAQSASFFKRAEAGGGVLIDAGAHTIDLLLWWLGDVATLDYQDDAMGGVEANSVLRLTMTSGATGTVHLSRDWPLPNRYVFECERGWIAYICDQVDRLEWGLHDPAYGCETVIREMAPVLTADRHLGAAVPGFMECFANQLRNVVAAVEGRASLVVPGTEGRKTVALIADCYRTRTLLDMPWLDSAELAQARRLAHV